MFRQAYRAGFLAFVIFFTGAVAMAAPYAALVMDARTGKVLHSRNADTRLHPASLTKMMTLYVTFEALRLGEITLDTRVKISKKAAAEPPSKLGLKAGQRIALRHLIRAASVKSANDAATALAEAISGSEAAFARRMNRTAKALGMTRSTFKNAHGLTEAGHLSTARDMTILGRHLFYDYPQFYNLFSRKSTSAAGKQVRNTNRKFLAAYEGADGIKTGYTNAAGFNLVASARRGNERIIATVFGGRSTATRNNRVAELLDLGFKLAPTRVAVRKPVIPTYGVKRKAALKTAVLKSPRPKPRVMRDMVAVADMMAEIGKAVAQANAEAEETASRAEIAATTDEQPEQRSDGLQVVTRVSTSGGQLWGVHLGAYATRQMAEKELLKTALQDLSSLDGALRKVVQRNGKFQANFVGMAEIHARRACQRLVARNTACVILDPES